MKKSSLTITGNVAYSAEIHDALAAKIISLCATEMRPTTSLFHQENTDDVASGETISVYMDRLRPRRNPDKILAIAAYITDNMGQKYFTPQEIRSFFSKASEAVPANFTRDFNWTLITKWLSEADDTRDMYFVTKKGMEVIDGGFPKALVKESRGKASGRKSVQKR